MTAPSLSSSRSLPTSTDDAPRLAFARELREHGDPRGEFIEAQCALARCAPDDLAARDALTARARALLAAHEESWLAPLGLRPNEAQWSRGFVEGVTLTPERLGEVSPRLVEAPHVRALHLAWVDDTETLARALEDPLCAQLEVLDLEPVEAQRHKRRPVRGRTGLGPGAAHALIAATKLTRLRELRLRRNDIGREGARALASAAHLAGLTHLDLYDNSVGYAGAKAIARARHFANLEVLDLGGWQFQNEMTPDGSIGSGGAHELAAATHMTRLRSLSLQWTGIDAHGAHALAEAPHLARLRELDIAGNDVRRAGGRALARRLTELRYLDIRANVLGAEGMREVVAALRNVESLDLGDNARRHESARVYEILAGAPHLTKLRKLWLSICQLGDEGLRALVKLPHLANVTTLAVAHDGLTAEGLRALVNDPRSAKLESLALSWNDLGDEGAGLLAGATHMKRLATLYVRAAGLTDAGLRALREAPHLSGCVVVGDPPRANKTSENSQAAS